MRVTRGKVPDVLAEGAPRTHRIPAYRYEQCRRRSAGALEVLFERISPAEWSCSMTMAGLAIATRKLAADEFMRDRGHAVLELPTGQGLVVKRSAPGIGHRRRKSLTHFTDFAFATLVV